MQAHKGILSPAYCPALACSPGDNQAHRNQRWTSPIRSSSPFRWQCKIVCCNIFSSYFPTLVWSVPINHFPKPPVDLISCENSESWECPGSGVCSHFKNTEGNESCWVLSNSENLSSSLRCLNGSWVLLKLCLFSLSNPYCLYLQMCSQYSVYLPLHILGL